MGSVGFDREDESLPSTSNGKKNKIPRKLLSDCVAVNAGSVPRKLRSVMKKRGRESITPPLPISRKHHHVSNGTEKPRKDGAKRSKLNMKPGRITKDEKEVAETLYALADMFSDATKANEPLLDSEPKQTKSSTLLKDTGNVTSTKQSSKTSSKVVLDAAYNSSNMLDSTAQVEEFQSSGDTRQIQVHFSEPINAPSASGVKSDLIPDSRPKLSAVDMTPRGERAIALERVVGASEIQYGNHYYPAEDKSNSLFMSPGLSATGTRSSETTETGLRFPTRFENTNFASQPRVLEYSVNDEYPQTVVESKKLRKRCATQVHICRLIKVLQTSERQEGLIEKPVQLATCEGSKLWPHTSTHNQTRGINGINESVSFNGIKQFEAEKHSTGPQNDILLHKRALQDQHLASETSALRQGNDYVLSLNGGDHGLNAGEGINGQDSHVSYMHLQNPKNGYSSTLYGHASGLSAAQQAQFPTYLSGTINSSYTARKGHQTEPHQHKWVPHFPSQYNGGGVAAKPYIPESRNGETESLSMLYTRTLFPHLNSAAAKYHQPFSLP